MHKTVKCDGKIKYKTNLVTSKVERAKFNPINCRSSISTK